jgi:hypothetical protein
LHIAEALFHPADQQHSPIEPKRRCLRVRGIRVAVARVRGLAQEIAPLNSLGSPRIENPPSTGMVVPVM